MIFFKPEWVKGVGLYETLRIHEHTLTKLILIVRIIRTRNILLLYEHYILYYSLFVSNFVKTGGRERERRTTTNDCKYEKASKEDRIVYLFKSFISWPVVVRRV